MPLSLEGDAEARLANGAGLELRDEESRILIDNLMFGQFAEQQGLDFDWEITQFQVEADRPRKEWFFIPAFMLALLVAFIQKRRLRNEGALA